MDERVRGLFSASVRGTGTSVSPRAVMTRYSRTNSCALGSTPPSGGRRRITVVPSVFGATSRTPELISGGLSNITYRLRGAGFEASWR